MALSRSDEVDLLTVLHEGPHEAPPWATFTARLQRRTRADEVRLTVGTGEFGERLRLGRVYAAAELVEPGSAEPGFGRHLRVSEPGGESLWLGVIRQAMDFTAADSALLSALAPHLAIALRTLRALDRGRARAAIADDLLRRAGISWVETAGQVGELTRRQRPFGGAAQALLARQFGLAPAEARLAARLVDGDSLAGAAAALGLTIETARTYSKRLFMKTGTRGPSDLVRLILTGTAVLA